MERVAQRAVSPQRLATAEDAGLLVHEIAVRYARVPALVLVTRPAQSSAIIIVRMNALDVNGHAQMIARQDAKRIAFRPAQRIVQTLAQTAQVDVETVALLHALMTAQVDAKAVATRPAQRIA